MSSPRHALRLIACALFLVPSAGCALFSDDIEPIWEIDDDEFVVVHPFYDAEADSAWGSRDGHELAAQTTEELATHADYNVVPYEEVLALMVASDPKRGPGAALDVRELTPRQLADLTGADYVILADVLELQLRDPKAVALVQARGTLEVKVFKVARDREEEQQAEELGERERRIEQARHDLGLTPKNRSPHGGRLVAGGRVTAIYPDTYIDSPGVPSLDPLLARRGLIQNLARKAAQLLYPHEPEQTSRGAGS